VQFLGLGIILPRPLTDYATICAGGSLCDIATGVCTRPGTIAAGINATLVASCAFTTTTWTNTTGCVNYCGTGANDPQCLTGYFCNCATSGSPGTCSADPCTVQKNAIVDCMTTNKCRDVWTGPQFQSLVWRSLSNGTCVYNFCQQQVWDYECCNTNYGTRGSLTNGVSCSNPPTAAPAPAMASTLSSGFLLLLSVCFFVFIVYL